MASYQVLEAPGPGLGAAIGEGIGTFAKGAAGGYLRKKKDEEDELKRNKYMDAAKEGGLELSDISFDEDGKPSYSYKRPKEQKSAFEKSPKEAIMRAMLGLGGEEETGSALGIKKEKVEGFPVAGGGMVIPNTPERDEIGPGSKYQQGTLDYGKTVKDALRQDFAPGKTTADIAGEYLGFPQPKAEEGVLPPEFTADIQNLKAASGDETDVFIKGLEALGSKYAGNPEALNRIKLILQVVAGG